MAKKKGYYLVLSLLIFCGCKEGIFNGWDNRFDIINGTSSPIYYSIGLNYPDTLPTGENPYTKDTQLFVSANSKGTFFINNKWENIFALCKSDTLMLFIFDSTSLASNSWEDVKSKCLILKRYDLTYEKWQNSKGDVYFT